MLLIFLDDCGSLSENNNIACEPHTQVDILKLNETKHNQYILLSFQQVSSLSDETTTTSSKVNKNDEQNNYSQQLRETDIEIRLDDCMQCFIRIPRCEVNID